jgi:PiT family inorganic phosphate transporter
MTAATSRDAIRDRRGIEDDILLTQPVVAELVAASTILLASRFGLPVSTTHVLSSGIAGTMVAQQSGLNRSTVRNIALAWVLTLPVSMLLAGLLFRLFLTLSRGVS